MKLSIVIPVKDEAENIEMLANRIELAMGNILWQCIWVNDGSTDSTLIQLNKLQIKNSKHVIIDLEKNYGQSAALKIGFQFAQGHYIGTLDGDGQNDPQDLIKMVKILDESNFDIVNGYRESRKDSFIRKISSKIANTIRRIVTSEYEVRDVGCSTRVFKKECTEQLPLFKGMHRFLPTLMKMNGYKMQQIPVNHLPRLKGETKYSVGNRLWVGIIDLYAVWWMRRRLVFPKIKSINVKK